MYVCMYIYIYIIYIYIIYIYVYIVIYILYIYITQSAEISQKQDERNLYAIMKTVCLPGYHHNGLVAAHALGHMIYGFHD